MITLVIKDIIPQELRARIWIDARPECGGFTEARLEMLYTTVDAHARAYYAAHSLLSEHHPEDTRRNAQSLFDSVDSSLLGELLQDLRRSYRPDTDVITRYWIALTLGKVGTCEARVILDDLNWETEPLPREGLRQAHDMLSCAPVR